MDRLEAISVQLGHVTAALARTETRLGETVGRLTRLEELVAVLVTRTEVTVAAAERAADEALAVHEALRRSKAELPCQRPLAPPCVTFGLGSD